MGILKSSTSNEELLNGELHGSDLGLELRALIRGHSADYGLIMRLIDSLPAGCSCWGCDDTGADPATYVGKMTTQPL